MQRKPLKKYETRGLYARLEDGSMVEVEVDGFGHVFPVKKVISAPEEGTPVPSPASQPEEQTGTHNPSGNFKMSMEALAEKIQESFGSSAAESVTQRIAQAMKNAKKSAFEEDDDMEDEDYPPVPTVNKIGKMTDNVFKARLKSIMNDNKFDRRVRGRTRGRLDMGRLYKVQTKSTSLFTEKMARKGKEYNIVMLVDCSGSMGGQKAKMAAQTAVTLAQNFEGLNINLAIVGFNHNIVVYKDFHEKLTDDNYEEINQAIAIAPSLYGAGDNHDYDALNRAYRMLSDKHTGKNIVLFLSDGNPSTCAIGDRKRNPKEYDEMYEYSPLDHVDKDQKSHLHALVKRNANVDSIGIGIMSHAWQIPNNFSVHDPSELKPQVINSIRKFVKRG